MEELRMNHLVVTNARIDSAGRRHDESTGRIPSGTTEYFLGSQLDPKTLLAPSGGVSSVHEACTEVGLPLLLDPGIGFKRIQMIVENQKVLIRLEMGIFADFDGRPAGVGKVGGPS